MDFLGEEFDDVLFRTRIDARHSGVQQAALELDISTIDAAAFTDEDQTRSRLIAMSLASAVGLAALILLRQGRANPIALAISLEDYRFRRAAATEAATAFEDGHNAAEPGTGWAKRWDATLDMKVCKTCLKMHGEVVLVGESFTDGLVPAYVHPNCRCITTYIPLALLQAA